MKKGFLKKIKNYLCFFILQIFIFLIFNTKTSLCLSLTEELLFVGEDVRVLSIASRHLESPEEASAVAEVITQEDIKRRGIRTLSEALSQVTGFFMVPLSGGTRPFLRGIPEGVLFLYDGVPLTSDSTKAVHPLDEELNLENISRIEIIRGPGSVLWGPDAFAGIVNLVPKKGHEAKGVSFSFLTGSPMKDKRPSISWGFLTPSLEGFLSFSFYEREPYREKYSFRKLKGRVDESRFWEGVFTLDLFRKLHFSGRFSSFKRPYVATDGQNSWPAKNKTPLSFLKLEAEKSLSLHSNLRFKAYYSYLNQKHREIYLNTRQKNHIFYLETLYDYQFPNRQGFLTAGISWRKNLVRNAAINIRGFLPEYLSRDEIYFSPIIDVADFNTRLLSFFLQGRYHSKLFDFWAGFRFDDHNQYESTLSYNFGIKCVLNYYSQIKILHGTAYRTPYSAQFLRRQNLEPEEIRNFSLELSINPFSFLQTKLIGFYNRIKDHVDEDPFGGFSFPSREEFLGLEAEANLKLFRNLFLWGNFTLFSQWGKDEYYRVLDYIIFTPEGHIEEIYSFYKRPFYPGTKRIANFGLIYSLPKNYSFSLRISYLGDRRQKILYSGEKIHLSDIIIVDANLRKKILLSSRYSLDLELSFKNLFDQRYAIFSSLSPIKAPPFTTYLNLRFHF